METSSVMVAKAERIVGMDYGEIKAYIQIGPKVQYSEGADLAATPLSLLI